MNTRPEPHGRGVTLVTGAPGWLGTRLVESLVRGLPDVADLAQAVPRAEVRCLVHPGADTADLDALPGVTSVRGDLSNPETLGRFVAGARGATLFHCAGVIHPTRVSEFEAVNAAGTRHLLEAAAEAGVSRFVHVSSNSPFGANPTPEHQFTEDSPYNPYMGYGRSKMAGEQAVWKASQAGRLETVIVRAPWFYGPGQPPRQTQFFTMIRKGSFPLVGDGRNRRSMAYVDNLCQGLLLCERREHARGQAFWVADERPYSMNEILETVENVMERDFGIPVTRKRLRLPSFASDVARLADRLLQAVGLYEQRIHVLSEMNLTIACSIDKARQQLGYRPVVGLEEGMRRSLAWVLSRGITV
jgi:nucleoside-diphosphate-sugar epimerase